MKPAILLLALVLTGCGDPTTVHVRDGEMAGCAVTSRGPTVADVAECKIWQAKQHAAEPTGSERDDNEVRERLGALEKRVKALETGR
jgi:hypothetical protein